MLTVKLNIVGKALLPTRASASTLKCSNRTSIVGRSRPTLHCKRVGRLLSQKLDYEKVHQTLNYYFGILFNIILTIISYKM